MPGNLVDSVERVVGGSVVEDEDFMIGEGLRAQRGQRFGDGFRSVTNRKDKRYARQGVFLSKWLFETDDTLYRVGDQAFQNSVTEPWHFYAPLFEPTLGQRGQNVRAVGLPLEEFAH